MCRWSRADGRGSARRSAVCPTCYLSFDDDGQHRPGFVLGNGTPEIGGLTTIQADRNHPRPVARPDPIGCDPVRSLAAPPTLAGNISVVKPTRNALVSSRVASPSHH